VTGGEDVGERDSDEERAGDGLTEASAETAAEPSPASALQAVSSRSTPHDAADHRIVRLTSKP
jgi:hypothetical protein